MHPGGIRTRNPSKQAAADLRLRTRGHRDGLYISRIIGANFPLSLHMGVYIYIYTHTHTHTYIHTYIYTFRHTYRVLVGKSEGKRPLGRPRRRWEVNIKMYLHEVVCGGMNWIELANDKDRWPALVNAVMILLVPYNAGNFLTS